MLLDGFCTFSRLICYLIDDTFKRGLVLPVTCNVYKRVDVLHRGALEFFYPCQTRLKNLQLDE